MAPTLPGTAVALAGPRRTLGRLAGRAGRLLSCVRFGEVLILQGTPALAVALAMGDPTWDKGIAGVTCLAANVLLVAHVWTINDWADRRTDEADPRKSRHVFTRKGVAPGTLLLLSLALLVGSLTVFAALSAAALGIAVGVGGLSLLYSSPGLRGKHTPLVSSLLHLAGGFVQFLLGYAPLAAIDARAVQIAGAFGLAFAAGHGVQELQDFDGDRRSGVRTNAVAFGRVPVFVATLAAFLAAYAYLAALAVAGLVPLRLGVPCVAIAALHLDWARSAYRAGLSFDCVRQYRRNYRAAWVLLGLSGASTICC